jgi:type II secretory pathway pseudopilin PulG
MNYFPAPRARSLRRRRGIYLIELIAALIVLGAVLLITGQVASTTTLASRQAQRLDSTIAQLDSAIALLRRDVWAAADLHTDAPTRLDLDTTDGRSIRWQAASDGTLTRTSPGGVVRIWRGLPALTFTARNALVTLAVARPADPHPANPADRPATAPSAPASPPDPPEERITFPSQWLMAGGAR